MSAFCFLLWVFPFSYFWFQHSHFQLQPRRFRFQPPLVQGWHLLFYQKVRIQVRLRPPWFISRTQMGSDRLHFLGSNFQFGPKRLSLKVATISLEMSIRTFGSLFELKRVTSEFATT